MEQIRPFPPTELIDQAEEDEAIRLAPALLEKRFRLFAALVISITSKFSPVATLTNGLYRFLIVAL